jgi:hypothetical protein
MREIETAETKRSRVKRKRRNELGEERIGFEGFWNRRKTGRMSERDCFRMAVDRNRICYKSNSAEEDIRLMNAFEKNIIRKLHRRGVQMWSRGGGEPKLSCLPEPAP